MKLLANENFPLLSVKILENSGFDIKSIGQDYSGIFDSEVMEIAIKERRTILTFEHDYGELIFKKGYRPLNGVIYLSSK
jgi:predicted nuclease of predicted toxin-antitoxin system